MPYVRIDNKPVKMTDEEYNAYIAGITPEKTWQEKRRASIAEGGYGTWQEQLEMINEQGLEAWQAHCAQVKLNIPKGE